MKSLLQQIWALMASVKLALFTLFALAITSIIGTVVPQGKPIDFYIKSYGANTAELFRLLYIPDMYNSPWFLSLLVLFGLNLTVCSIERIPKVWRLVTQNNLDKAPASLAKMKTSSSFTVKNNPDMTVGEVDSLLAKKGWKIQKKIREEGTLFFAQKGAWTRFAVYIVHLSILVIFAGAIIGSLFGYKGSVMIPEGTFTDKIYKFDADHTPIPLGFNVRCDRFSLTYYDSGAPKEFRSDLVVIEDGKEDFSKSIIVNDPMDYKGFTFYQSSYQAIDNEFLVSIENNKTKATQKFAIPPRQQSAWQEEDVSYGIVNIGQSSRLGKYRYKIWFSDNKGTPSEFWVEEETPILIERPETTYTFSVKQRFATGLQVAKDPGVMVVYAGCTIMLLGLYVVFFLSHRRIWVFVDSTPQSSKIVMSGTANKNKLGFEKEFSELNELLQKNDKP